MGLTAIGVQEEATVVIQMVALEVVDLVQPRLVEAARKVLVVLLVPLAPIRVPLESGDPYVVILVEAEVEGGMAEEQDMMLVVGEAPVIIQDCWLDTALEVNKEMDM